MSNKESRSIAEQIALLKQRGMRVGDEQLAHHLLSRISYYRLKGYWWDMQTDKERHIFKHDACFEEVIARYEYDRELRLILFNAVEAIEIALRTKMIYYLSQSYGGLFYLDASLFDDPDVFKKQMATLKSEFLRSSEPFVRDFKEKYGIWYGQECLDFDEQPDSWVIFELASLGTLSKIYKNLKHQLPEKARIANDFGLNLHSELSSWLEAVTYLRNLLAHHSRIFGRTMVKIPMSLANPKGAWHNSHLTKVERKKPYLIVTSMLYMCNGIGAGEAFKHQMISFFASHQDISPSKLGFPYDWASEPIWST